MECIKKEEEDIIGVVPKKREILILPFLLSFGILDVPGLNFFKIQCMVANSFKYPYNKKTCETPEISYRLRQK